MAEVRLTREKSRSINSGYVEAGMSAVFVEDLDWKLFQE